MGCKLVLYTVGAFLLGGILLALAIGYTVAEGIVSLVLYIPAATLLLFSAVGFSAMCCEGWEHVCCPERRTQESSANHNIEAAGLVNEDSLSNNIREAELTYYPE